MATNQDAPFGLKPIGKVGQNRDNQGLSEYDVAASATAIYFNDPVKMKSDGTIEVAGAGGAILGSLGGIFFTDATTGKPTFANHLNASNTATDIVGFVSDDPYQRFEIQTNNSSASQKTDIFNVADIVYIVDFIIGDLVYFPNQCMVDLNIDNNLNVADIILLIELILGG